MTQNGRSARSNGFLSAVVADSRAATSRPPGTSAHEPDSPQELAVDRIVDPFRRDHPDTGLALRPRRAPAAIALARQRRETDVRTAEGPVTDQDVAHRGEGFEPTRQQQAAATDGIGKNDLATADTFAPEATLRRDVIQERAPALRSDSSPNQTQETERAGPDGPLRVASRARFHARDAELVGARPSKTVVPPARPEQAGGIPQSEITPARDRARAHVPTRRPFATRPETSARATGEPETPDFATEIRSGVVPATEDGEQSTSQQRPSPETRQPRARNGEGARLTTPRTPVTSRGPADAGTRLPRAIQPANSGRPQAAPPAVHIGTLDIRIEAPKQRPQAPPRQPVSFRGSGILSRLYLRRL